MLNCFVLFSAETNSPPVFSTNSYLVDDEKELEFLRKLCEIMIILLLPRGYSLPPLKVLLSEILSYKSKYLKLTKFKEISLIFILYF